MSLFCNCGCRPQNNCCGSKSSCVDSCQSVQDCTCDKKCTCTKTCAEDCVCDSVSDEATNACSCDCTCTCTCNCNCNNSQGQTGGQVTPEPQTVRALLNTVIDSCCTTEDVCREITVCCPDIFDPEDLEVGMALDVELAGDVTFKEVTRDKDDCLCVSTVRFNIPIRIFGSSKCGCCKRALTRNITVIRSARLCCAENSVLTTVNSRVIAASAVVSEICGNEVTIAFCLLFRSCLQQTMFREYTWLATPVCVFENCNTARNSLVDPCDMVCGCAAAGAKTCPSC